jgi:hypothetical protein
MSWTVAWTCSAAEEPRLATIKLANDAAARNICLSVGRG